MGLLQRSLSAGALILCILLIRRLSADRLPRRLYSILWEIALLRLLLPFYLPVGGLFDKWLPAPGQGWTAAGAELISIAAVGKGGAEASFITGGKLIWLAGLAVTAAVFAYGYIRCSLRLRESIPFTGLEREKEELLADWKWRLPGQDIRLRTLDTIISPVTYGVAVPKIILPKTMDFEDKETIRFVLRHELVHIKYMDNFWKILSIAALCMHWFNPLVWALYFLFDRDMEAACDQSVIAPLEEAERQKYALTLVKMTEKNALFRMLYSGFGRSAVSERIVAIMKYKKMTAAGAVCAVLLLAGGITVFASTKEPESKHIEIFFEEGISDAKVQEIGDIIETEIVIPSAEGAYSASFVSGTEAWEKFSKTYLAEGMKEEFTWNPLENSVSYSYSIVGDVDQIVKDLETLDGVRKIRVDDEE